MLEVGNLYRFFTGRIFFLGLALAFVVISLSILGIGKTKPQVKSAATSQVPFQTQKTIVAFSSRLVCSLLGPNQKSVGIYGQDGGVSTSIDGRSHFMFGDITGSLGQWILPNSVSYNADTSVSACPNLTSKSTGGVAQPLFAKLPALGEITAWPVSWIDGNVSPGFAYFYYASIDSSLTAQGFGLAKMSTGDLSTQRLGNCTTTSNCFLWNNKTLYSTYGIKLMDARATLSGSDVYVFVSVETSSTQIGIGLMKVPLSAVANNNIADYQYWNGTSFVSDISLVAPIWRGTNGLLWLNNVAPFTYTHGVSVRYNNFLGKWVAMYNTGIVSVVAGRVADNLTGPWSNEVTLVKCDQWVSGSGGFLCYGGAQHPQFANGSTIYETYSNGTDYQVYLQEIILGSAVSQWSNNQGKTVYLLGSSNPPVGYTLDGNAFSASSTPGDDLVPIYDWLDTASGVHLYETTSPGATYSSQGIAFYAKDHTDSKNGLISAYKWQIAAGQYVYSTFDLSPLGYTKAGAPSFYVQGDIGTAKPPSPTPTPVATPSPTPITGVPDKSAQYQMPVLILKYFPTKDGVNLDSSITGINVTLSNIRAHVDKITSEAKAALQAGSVYHGYKDSSAAPSLNYSIIDQKEYLTALPTGIEVPWKLGQGVYRPDYGKILTDLNICNYVDNQGLREVWLYGWHFGNIEPAESVMSGPYGDTSNSGGGNFKMPVCSKSYVLYNYNYGRGTNEAVHDHGHQIEIMMKHVGDPMFENNFIGPFSTYGSNDGSGSNFHRCGWTHVPPNNNGEYDYANTRYTWTDCEDWEPDGLGQKTYINCNNWLCNEAKYHTWRWQNMPGLNNPNPELSNWWDFVGDWDKAISIGEKLYYPLPTPTPTPRPTIDTDGDGFTDFVENYIGTDASKACGLDAWPPDFNNDGVVDTSDLTLAQSYFGTKVGDANYDKRYDLDANGLINILDLALVGKYNGKTCATPSPTPTPPPTGGDPSALTAVSTCNGSNPVITFKWQDNANYETGFWLDVSTDAFNGSSTTSTSPSVWGVKGIYRSPIEIASVGAAVQFAWDNEPASLTAGQLDNGDTDSKTSGSQLLLQGGETYYWRVKAFNFNQGSNHVYPGNANPPGQSITAASCP